MQILPCTLLKFVPLHRKIQLFFRIRGWFFFSTATWHALQSALAWAEFAPVSKFTALVIHGDGRREGFAAVFMTGCYVVMGSGLEHLCGPIAAAVNTVAGSIVNLGRRKCPLPSVNNASLAAASYFDYITISPHSSISCLNPPFLSHRCRTTQSRWAIFTFHTSQSRPWARSDVWFPGQ